MKLWHLQKNGWKWISLYIERKAKLKKSNITCFHSYVESILMMMMVHEYKRESGGISRKGSRKGERIGKTVKKSTVKLTE
jgi:hypothetical protein